MLSAIPYVCQAVSGLGVGLIADLMRSKQLLSTTATRRLWCSVGITPYIYYDIDVFVLNYNFALYSNLEFTI